MNILIFYQYFGTPRGSWSTRVYENAKRWVDKGHQVTVITSPYEKSDITAKGFISTQIIDGINVIVINSSDSNRMSIVNRIFRAFLFAMVASFLGLRQKNDVILASSGPITIGIPGLINRWIKRKPLVFEVRDLWPGGGIEMGMIKNKCLQRIALWFESLCYHQASVVVTASIGQKHQIAARFPDLIIEVIPNASDLELFGVPSLEKLPNWTNGKKLFTHIGSMGFIHNMRFWMEVAKALKTFPEASNILFVFIGEGSERRTLEDLKEKWRLENVIFLGLKPKAELTVWVQNSLATLFATLDNPIQNTCSPNKIFDSFAAGVPIVQTSTGWIGELVVSEHCGINVPLDSPQVTAQTICKLSYDIMALSKMGRQAKRLAETVFNRNTLAQKYLDILDDIRNY